MTAPLEAVMRSVVDGPLIDLLAPPLLPVSGAMQAWSWELAQSAARHKDCLSACFSD